MIKQINDEKPAQNTQVSSRGEVLMQRESSKD